LARIEHTYTATGTYTVLITAADNGYIDDSDPNAPEMNKKFAGTSYEVDVIF
jgi:hypothetical protein